MRSRPLSRNPRMTMILVSEAGWRSASGFEYFSAWATSLVIARAAARGVRPNKQQRSPRRALELPRAIAHPVLRSSSHPIQTAGMGCLAKTAFFKALRSPARAGGAGTDRVSTNASHRSASRGAKGTQVNRELVESRPAARCPLSAKIEIKQTASLIAQMNRLPNSLVGSRLEQRRW
jgi:hypothetical protein